MRESRPGNLSPPRSLVRRLLRLFAELSLFATACVLLARVWWFFELFANFRVQLLCVQLVLLTAFLVMRRPVWALTLAAASVINGLAVRDYVLPGRTFSAETTQPAQIRVLSANVRAANTTTAGLIEVVSAVEPDVFAVLELTDRFVAALRTLDDAYPHQLLIPQDDNFGIGVYSRWPFADTDVLDLYSFAAIDAQIQIDGMAVRFIAAHLVPPVSADMAALRNRQLEQLGEYVAARDAPHIVVGDFNLTPFSPYFDDFIDQTGLDNAGRGFGPSYTWPGFFAPLGIPIDHVLVSADFEVADFFRAGAIGSDHFPVIADVNRSRNGLD